MRYAFKNHWSDSRAAIRDVESALAAMKAEHDLLASQIFVSRPHYRTETGNPYVASDMFTIFVNFAIQLEVGNKSQLIHT